MVAGRPILAVGVSFIEEIFKRLLGDLTGFDLLTAVIVIVAGVTGWFLIGAKNKTEKKKLAQQIRCVALLMAAGFVVIGIHHLIPPKSFPTEVEGILVLRIEGDDGTGSLQRELVSSLNVELAKETNGPKLKVWAADDSVGEKQGLGEAHSKARRIGQRRKALLVVWGAKSKAGETKIFPRVTIVRTNEYLGLALEHTFKPQEIYEVTTPTETVGQPIYLAHFIAGYWFYKHTQYSQGLSHFAAALQSTQATPGEKADLQFFSGTSHNFLAYGQINMQTHLQAAINDLVLAAGYYAEAKCYGNLVATLNNLGIAFGELTTGRRTEHVAEAIALFQQLSEVYASNNLPVQWARAQNNLGVAYVALPTGNRAENLTNAIGAYRAALGVRTEKDCPLDWAQTLNNLGVAYSSLKTGNATENLRNAIAAFKAALRVRTRKNFPVAWAMTQNNLAVAYAS